MGRIGPSVRIAPGIFEDATGRRVQASFRGRKREQRFPLTAPLREMTAWQEATRTTLRKGRVIIHGAAGTLAADVVRYLHTVTHLAGYKSRRSELHAWTALYGPTPRLALTAEQVRLAIARWRAAGKAPKTIRNRLVALAALYHTLDGAPGQPAAPTPVDGITIDVPKRRPAYVPVSVVIAVEAQLRAQRTAGRLRDDKTRARFMVMAATGVRPAALTRVQPQDVDLKRRTWFVAGGKGGEPISFWLNDDMLAAWRIFVRAQAWGAFDTRSMARVLRTAGWPPGVRPYAVRHAVGQDLAEQGEDYEDIAAWLGHSDVATTKRYYVPILSGRLRDMAQRLAGRLGWATVPQSVPQRPVRRRPKLAETGRKQTRPVQRKRA